MISTVLFSLALSLASPAAEVFADLPEVRLEPYAVHGATLDALRSEIERRGPVSHQGRRFHALTTWRYRYSFLHDGRGDCLPRSATATVEVSVALPQLADPDALDRTERDRWDRYVWGLATHEREHVRLVLMGRDRLERALRNARSCEAMADTARRVQAEVDDRNADLDRRTGHGRLAPF